MSKRSYIIQSVFIICAYVSLSALVTARVLSATQLPLLTQIAFCIFLWGFCIWFAIVLRRHYLKLTHA